MGSTANLGLPYPDNTDPLANVAAAIQSLANMLDTLIPGKIKRGSDSLVFNASGEATLTHNMTAIPTTILCAQRAGGAGTALLVEPKAGTYTATQVTLVARNGANAYTGGTLTIDWIAIK